MAFWLYYQFNCFNIHDPKAAAGPVVETALDPAVAAAGSQTAMGAADPGKTGLEVAANITNQACLLVLWEELLHPCIL